MHLRSCKSSLEAAAAGEERAVSAGRTWPHVNVRCPALCTARRRKIPHDDGRTAVAVRPPPLSLLEHVIVNNKVTVNAEDAHLLTLRVPKSPKQPKKHNNAHYGPVRTRSGRFDVTMTTHA